MVDSLITFSRVVFPSRLSHFRCIAPGGPPRTPDQQSPLIIKAVRPLRRRTADRVNFFRTPAVLWVKHGPQDHRPQPQGGSHETKNGIHQSGADRICVRLLGKCLGRPRSSSRPLCRPATPLPWQPFQQSPWLALWTGASWEAMASRSVASWPLSTAGASYGRKTRLPPLCQRCERLQRRSVPGGWFRIGSFFFLFLRYQRHPLGCPA